jgi:hypothetical protein
MFKLRESQNEIERNASKIMEAFFPNYEIFWDKFLEPLKGTDSNWRYDTLHNLEEIGISQYGILKSINFILLSKEEITVGDPLQRFKNIYFHFGLVFDSVENLARNICIVGNLLEIIFPRKVLSLDKATLMNEFEKWVDKDYLKSYEKLTELGKPIFYYPQGNENFIRLLIQKPLLSHYNIFITNIRIYRNFYIHTPGVDIIRRLYDNKLFAIKKEYLQLYRHWSFIRTSFDKNIINFDDPKVIVENDLNETLRLLNSVWQSFIEIMDKIIIHHNYNKLTSNYIRDK